MNKFTAILFALSVNSAHSDGIQNDFKNLGKSLKEAGREVGKKGKEFGQAVGQEAKKVGKEVADDTKELRTEAKEASKQTGHWFRDTFTDLGLQIKKTWKSWFAGN